jgi:hypothetical protein
MTEAVRELQEAAAEYITLQEARDKALTRLQEAIRAADRDPTVNRAQIIRMAQVARQTVYDALSESDPNAAGGAGRG